ncbi:MAG: M48 family metalloprotease [Desulfatibacillum sp.]|nr:M48 family metalloprotease [Desulfatibacillum sp.]
MFTNLIILMAVLVSYEYAPESRDLLFFQGKIWHTAYLAALFFVITRLRFSGLMRRIPRLSKSRSMAVADRMVVQQMLLAILFFVTSLFMTPFKPVLLGLPLLREVPTLAAILAMLLFLAHLAVVWFYSHPIYKILNQTIVPRIEYVKQQVVLVLPLLLPWVVFYAVQDLLLLVPYQPWQAVLMSTAGQIGYIVVMMTFLILLGPVAILKFWGCTPIPPGPVRARMEALCQRADFTCAQILQWPLFGGHMITAAVFGIVSRFRYILMTDAMLRVATPEELDAVLTHEIGHAKKKHMLLFLLIVGTMAPAGYLLWSIFDLAILYLVNRFTPPTMDGNTMAMLLRTTQGLFFVSFAVLYLRFVFGYFLRNFERQADLYVYEVLPSALPLVTMFRKIAYYSGRSADEPNWHHFGINQRINYILQCESNKQWIGMHHAKVRKSLAVLVACLVVVLASQGALAWNNTHQRLRLGVSLAGLEGKPGGMAELTGSPGLIGDLYLDTKIFDQAIAAYESALKEHPNDANLLNNLAWTYATCEKEELRNPQRALELAARAAELEPAPHILDTLAESYFVNSMFDLAVETEIRAMEAMGDSPESPEYREHLEKYKAARDGK